MLHHRSTTSISARFSFLHRPNIKPRAHLISSIRTTTSPNRCNGVQSGLRRSLFLEKVNKKQFFLEKRTKNTYVFFMATLKSCTNNSITFGKSNQKLTPFRKGVPKECYYSASPRVRPSGSLLKTSRRSSSMFCAMYCNVTRPSASGFTSFSGSK